MNTSTYVQDTVVKSPIKFNQKFMKYQQLKKLHKRIHND